METINQFEQRMKKGFKCGIVGASGAVGRELVQQLSKSPKWTEVVIVTRRILDEWKDLLKAENSKFKILQMDDLEALKNVQDAKFSQFKDFDSFFCLLGGRSQKGDKQFRDSDYFFPLYFAKLGQTQNVRHYSIVSAVGADKKSLFLYNRTKGEIEESLKELKYDYLSILQPGLIANRQNDSRILEKIFNVVPFIPKIQASDLGRAAMIDAENALNQLYTKNPSNKIVSVLNNTQLRNLSQQK